MRYLSSGLSRSMERGLRALLLGLLMLYGAACGLFDSGVDERAPGVEIVRPGPSAAVTGEVVVRIQATARGANDNYVSFVNVNLDGQRLGEAELVTAGETPVFIFRWNSLETPDGVHRLEAVAFDRYQARGLSAPVQVVVANESAGSGPVAAIVAPRDAEEVRGITQVIAQPQPGQPAITRMDFIVDGVTLASREEAPYVFDWNTAQETVGTHSLRVKAYSEPGVFRLSDPVFVSIAEQIDGGGNGGDGSGGDQRPGTPVIRAAGLTGEVKGSVAVGFNNDLYIGTLSDTLYAFAPTGHLRWKFATNGPIRSSPVVGNNEDVFVTSEDGRLYGLTSTGAQLWTPYSTGTMLRSTPSLGIEGGLFFGDGEGRVHAVNSFNGLTLQGWPVKVTNVPIVTPPVILRDRTVIVAATDGYVYALGPDGELRWRSEVNIGSLTVGMALAEREFSITLPNGDVSTTISTVIYLVSNDGRVYALSAVDGTLSWSYPLTGPLRSGPIVGPDGAIYVGTSTGLVALNEEADAFTPRLRFIYPATDVGTPVIDSNESVYFVSGERLIAINPNNTPIWEYNLDTEADGPLTIGRNGLVYVAGNNGILFGVETGSQGLAPEKWPMFQRNARHTGRIGIDATDG